ncbi:amidase, partial [Actinomadura sp. DSM 109109]|nr:amidase [Actinomadura lepetitiana]
MLSLPHSGCVPYRSFERTIAGGGVELGLAGQAEALARGEVSSCDLVEQSLEAIGRQESLGAFRVVRAEAAAQEALEADKRLADGERLPLLGVPVAIKDDTDIAGETTPFAVAADHRPVARDGEVVRKLRAAGAVVVGKTTTCELGLWPFSESREYGIARNPWNPEYSPGG